MTKDAGTRKSESEIERKRAARRDSIPIGVVLVIAVVALAVSDAGDPSDVVIWAVPMLALGALGLWAEIRDLRRADEYQRTLLLESLALGFALVLGLLFVGSLFVALGVGDPRTWVHISFIGGVLGWSAIKAIRTRRG